MDTNKPQKKKKWFLPLVVSLLLSTLLIFITVFTSSSSSSALFYRPRVKKHLPHFVESKLKISETSKNPVPRLAYLISGSVGDGGSLKRTLKALYHPRNQYAVHLDLEASAEERLDLARFVKEEPLFAKLGNVRAVVRANLVTYRGPTMVTNTLHAAAILLKEGGEWDWFINLSASDYPLVTQDDLLHVLSSIPRNLNFIEHTSDIGWKEDQRAKPVIIDPGLYSRQKSDVFWISQKRSVPTAYKLFTGSAWMMLSRPFIEYILWGWDNLPRTVLMYYANFLSSPEGYFHTVICNAEEFQNTTVNHDLHFISWDNPPKQHPHFLVMDDFQRMVDSNAPFARKFGRNESVLDKIDSELLGCNADGYVPGGWFSTQANGSATVPDYSLKNITTLRPGLGAQRLKRLVTSLISAEDFHAKQCTSSNILKIHHITKGVEHINHFFCLWMTKITNKEFFGRAIYLYHTGTRFLLHSRFIDHISDSLRLQFPASFLVHIIRKNMNATVGYSHICKLLPSSVANLNIPMNSTCSQQCSPHVGIPPFLALPSCPL